MAIELEFEWDDHKAATNAAKHGVAFGEAVAIDARLQTIDTTRPGDGEDRSKAIGMIEGRLFTVVFTRRGEILRLISARRANSREERLYGYR